MITVSKMEQGVDVQQALSDSTKRGQICPYPNRVLSSMLHPTRISFLPSSHEAYRHKLVLLTGGNPVPVQVVHGVCLSGYDLKTTHEEADLITVQQMKHLAREGGYSIKVICDDTDVFLLPEHHYHSNNINIPVVMEGTSGKRSVCSIPEAVIKYQDIMEDLL